jgi:peptidyl-prolyl cis-trans isomerase D
VLRVTDHQPSQQRPLAEVQDAIVARLREDKSRAAAAEAAAALASRVNAGEPLAAVAASAGLSLATSQPVNRAGPTTADGAPMAPELLKAAFQAARPAAAGKVSAGVATLASGDPVVFVVESVKPGTPESLGVDLAEQVQALAGQTAGVEFDAYVTELRRTAKIKRNEQLFSTE